MNAIFSDVHGNIEALRATLAEARRHGVEQFFCLGDVLSNDPSQSEESVECLHLLRDLGCTTLMGDHEACILSDNQALASFKPVHQASFRKMTETLSPEDLRYLQNLPLIATCHNSLFAHASLDNPRAWNYIYTDLDAERSFTKQRRQFCFVGHTHFPSVYVKTVKVHRLLQHDFIADLRSFYLVNVGSISRSRDGDERPSFVLFDPEKRQVKFVRVDSGGVAFAPKHCNPN